MGNKRWSFKITVLLCLILSISTMSSEIYLQNRWYGNASTALNYDSINDGGSGEGMEVGGNIETFNSQNLKFRIRNYSSVANERKDGQDYKFEYYFHHGFLVFDKIRNITQIEYRSYFKNNNYYIGEKFAYLDSKYLDYISLIPFYMYTEYAYNKSHVNNIGVALEFGVEKFMWNFHGKITITESIYSDGAMPNAPMKNTKYKNNVNYLIELYAVRTLYMNTYRGYISRLNIEIGADPLEFNQRKMSWNPQYTEAASNYATSLYMFPNISVEKLITQNTKIF